MERIACRTGFSLEEDVQAVKCIGAVSLVGVAVWVLVLGISVAVRRAARKWDEKRRRNKMYAVKDNFGLSFKVQGWVSLCE